MADTEALVKQADVQAIAIEADIKSMVKDARELAINDESSYGKASDIVKIFKAKKAWLGEDRKKLTDPINNSVKIIIAKYKPQIDECDIWIKAVDKKMYAYKEAEEAKRRIEEAKRRAEEQSALEAHKKEIVEAAVETGSDDLLERAVEIENQQADLKAQPIEIVKSRAVGTLSTAAMADHWKAEVINDALVPVGLKSTDDKKVREHLKKLASDEKTKERMKNGEQLIPGLKIWNEPSSVSR